MLRPWGTWIIGQGHVARRQGVLIIVLTLDSLLDIKYEPHVCKNSQETWLTFLLQFKHVWCLYLWKVHEERALAS